MEVGGPSVQSLAPSGASNVPERFIRPFPDCSAGELDELPIIDASRLSEESEIVMLHQACSEWGFFQLTGHGIPSSLLENTRRVIRGFFHRPQAKELYSKINEEINQLEGYGKYFLPSEESVLDWGDTFFHFLPPGVIPWPANPPEYRAPIEEYSEKVKLLGNWLLAALSVALKQEPDFFLNAFGSEPHLDELVSTLSGAGAGAGACAGAQPSLGWLWDHHSLAGRDPGASDPEE